MAHGGRNHYTFVEHAFVIGELWTFPAQAGYSVERASSVGPLSTHLRGGCRPGRAAAGARDEPAGGQQERPQPHLEEESGEWLGSYTDSSAVSRRSTRTPRSQTSPTARTGSPWSGSAATSNSS